MKKITVVLCLFSLLVLSGCDNTSAPAAEEAITDPGYSNSSGS